MSRQRSLCTVCLARSYAFANIFLRLPAPKTYIRISGTQQLPCRDDTPPTACWLYRNVLILGRRLAYPLYHYGEQLHASCCTFGGRIRSSVSQSAVCCLYLGGRFGFFDAAADYRKVGYKMWLRSCCGVVVVLSGIPRRRSTRIEKEPRRAQNVTRRKIPGINC